MSNGKTLEQNLLDQATLLKELIQKHLKDYLRSHHPNRYIRSGGLENSVVVENSVRVVGDRLQVLVSFNESANHRSGYGVWSIKDGRGKYDDDDGSFSSGGNVNTALLLNNGYKVTKPVWFADVPNFGYREGAEFVQKAIAEFNRINPMGLILSDSDIIIR
ncbi:MAG: hypothetical protein HDT43_01865 [Ruminococcaceae bacterium]|nr:hypothetical protein [Oscillospiraceae bacterium]